MSRIRSLGARLTGKHINTAAERISVVSDKIPMKSRISLVDKGRVCLVNIGDGKEPVFGIDQPEKYIDLNHLKGVFRDGEVLDASVENGCLYFTKGKDAYWFPLDDYYEMDAKYPDLDPETEFRMDPRKLSKAYSKELKGGFARLMADYDESGRKIVRAVVYDKNRQPKGSIILAGTWTGSPSRANYPMDYLKDIGRFGNDAEVRMSTDYPMEMIVEGDVPTRYLLAPVVGLVGEDPDGKECSVGSMNRRRAARGSRFRR